MHLSDKQKGIGLSQILPIIFNAFSETLNYIQFNNVKDVPIEENTGLDSRTEQFKGVINPHVIRRAPFRVFEILKPVNNYIIAETKYSLLNLKIYIPEKIDSGNHLVKLSFKIGSKVLPGYFFSSSTITKAPS